MPLLQVEHLTHFFGGLRAVKDYNLAIRAGEVHGLIGPNGAGKTTVFNLITGMYRPSEGRILLEGALLNGLAPHEIAHKGIGRTFQNMRLWRHMTVLEHVKLAHYSRIEYGLAGAFFDTPRRRMAEARIEGQALHLLNMMGIEHLAGQIVINLPYGAQRRVEMARAPNSTVSSSMGFCSTQDRKSVV